MSGGEWEGRPNKTRGVEGRRERGGELMGGGEEVSDGRGAWAPFAVESFCRRL